MTRHFHEPVTFFLGSVPLRFSYILHLNIPLYCTIYFLCHNLGTIFATGCYTCQKCQNIIIITPHFHEPVTFFWGSVPLRFSYILHLNIPLYCTIYFLCRNLGTIFGYRLLNLSEMPKYNYYDESLSRNRNIFLGECTSEIFLYITPKYTTLLHYILFMP